MRSTRRTSGAWVVVVTMLVAAASVAAAKGNGAEETIAGRIKDELAAWQTLDPGKAARFYAKDADLVFFDVAPLQYKGWGQYEAGTREMFATFKSIEFTSPADIRTRVQGNMAWSTYTTRLAAVMKDGDRSAFDTRVTAVWEKRQGEWLLVHEHVSMPLPEPPATPATPGHGHAH